MMQQNRITKGLQQHRRRLSLTVYDSALLLFVDFIFLVLNPSGSQDLKPVACLWHILLTLVCFLSCRYAFHVYRQVWRYGGSLPYIRLMFADAAACVVYFVMQRILPISPISFIRAFSISACILLLSMSIRMLYQYLYEYAVCHRPLSGRFWLFIQFLSGNAVCANQKGNAESDERKIHVAIVGAGRVGALLAEELLKNPRSASVPRCFIDIDSEKIGREIAGIPVLSRDAATAGKLASMQIQEIIFALPNVSPERKRELYEDYSRCGCKMKVYDYPLIETADRGKRHLRNFDIEELLFRDASVFDQEKTGLYYRDKVIMITGGGGSIGSELCRQLAKMSPKKLVILDIYENGAYDVQQELRIAYGKALNIQIEIVSVCDRAGLEKVFAAHRPDIVIHAAAHKHVPLMEHNICEAVKNNVFGTLNTVELCRTYGVGRFMMVSTDKAVNPTNVMGATKRICEMIVQSHSRNGSGTVFSATRFGNVLGSAGSVIPLFRRQIQNGGPVTVTDKRIIRYFMTIPEASQLVLESGALALNGELFVLDMGKPVRILDLAESLIRLSGYEPYQDIEIIETGLRPGEKLYEELLIRTEELDKTENSKIFIERDKPIPLDAMYEKLEILRTALESEQDQAVKEALFTVVPTYHTAEEINRLAEESKEMQVVER